MNKTSESLIKFCNYTVKKRYDMLFKLLMDDALVAVTLVIVVVVRCFFVAIVVVTTIASFVVAIVVGFIVIAIVVISTTAIDSSRLFFSHFSEEVFGVIHFHKSNPHGRYGLNESSYAP